jgi:endo-1,4-beta-D-glucanase Y
MDLRAVEGYFMKMTIIIRKVSAAILISSMGLFAAWNLPYPQPAKWDYSSHYADDIKLMVTNNPTYFKDKMATKWNYFKTTFIMSNGLVNHSKFDGSAVTGTNEAVSEGQGYGMLLAVLNNDQATFNKIFQAANQYLWNSGKKSYYCWEWKNGSCAQSGAASDADLDIGLALVFADKLVIEKYWTAFSNPDYKTRALEIIRSIRTNMCDGSGYLLAGDNWSGNSPQNPSYYAVAWMKVFNAYCKANGVNDIDYTQVVSRCYEVLAKCPRYNKGQAPDWCNTSGGNVGKSYGMGPDGIRTPWRIAMDALWFNESRAITYCNNIKNTLTQYSNSNTGPLILQMGEYSDQGTVVAETYRCNQIGLWMCGALGSSDAAFKKGVFRQNVLLEMQGSYASFGSPTYSDDKFYYKQATAGLAYMAFSGQFPNVWEDTFVETLPVASKPVAARNIKVIVSGNTIKVSGFGGRITGMELFSVDGKKSAVQKAFHTGSSCSIATMTDCSKGTYIIKITGNVGEKTASAVTRFALQ